MIKQISIGAFLTAGLVGCGGDSSSDSNKLSAEPYSLAAYQDRVVDTTTIDGTWVAISSGNFSSSSGGIPYSSTYYGKEYFVIKTVDYGNNGGPVLIEKGDCSGDKTIIQVSGDTISYRDFQGTISDNSAYTGTFTNNYSDIQEDYIEKDTATVEAIKISDSVDNFATLSINSQIEGTSTEELNCFHQINGVGSSQGQSASFNEYGAGSDDGYLWTEIYNSNPVFSWLEIDLELFDHGLYLYSDEGNSINVTLNSQTDLNLNLSFNGSSDTESVTGSIQLQLPAQ